MSDQLNLDVRSLYALKLHETYVTFFGIVIMRVPSGWLYDCWDIDKDVFKQGTFVPYGAWGTYRGKPV